jgi:hypothetical protein
MKKNVKSDCKFLRTKTAYLHEVDDFDYWRSNESSTSTFWCLHTMTPTGPDDRNVNPESCQDHRTCFRHRDE